MLINFFKGNSSKNCYLLSANVFDKKTLNNKDWDDYDKMLAEPDTDPYFKQVITMFFIPYKISFLKWTLNDEYFKNPFPVDLKYNHRHIAPSLKRIKEDSLKRAMGYPNWFYAAFPDVLEWAAQRQGFEVVNTLLSKYSDEELIDGNKLSLVVLVDIVNAYINTTKQPLECKKY